MSRQILTLFIGILFISCTNKDNYPENPKISNEIGVPNDSLTFYIPNSIQSESKIEKIEIDSSMISWISTNLFCSEEPILYNYYLGHDIYRFLWLRSFDVPVVISLHKNGEKVWLVTKKLDKQPMNMDLPPESKMYFKNKNVDIVSRLSLNQTKILTEKDWTEFEVLIQDCSFWTTKPYKLSMGIDGSDWIFEGHLRNKYWYVIKWSPEDSYKTLGEFLINKSGLKDEIY